MSKGKRHNFLPGGGSGSQQHTPRAELLQALSAGLQHHHAGRLQQAEAIYRDVLRRDPDNPDALHLLGRIALQTRNLPIAAGLIERAVRLKPRSVAYQCSFAQTLRAQGNNDAAIERYRLAIKLDPASLEAHNNLGNLLQETGQSDAAIRHFERALALKPDSAEPHNNLGIALQRTGKLPEAIKHYRRAVALKADYANAWFNIGNWHRDSGNPQEATVSYEKALALNPDTPDGRMNLGMARLLMGDFERGWDGYEYRAMHGGRAVVQDGSALPVWEGEPIAGKSILLHAEQGFGDTIQFARFAPFVAARGARVLLEVQPELKNLLAQSAGAERVLARGEPRPRFDIQCPLPSLPRALETRLHNIPADIPYIRPDAALVEQWGGRLGRADTLRVGLVWAGNPHHHNDRNRSIPFTALQPLVEIAGISVYSLQKGPAGAQATGAPRLLMLGEELRDFADTAAVLAHMDLIITVDTVLAHLAGAMGRRTWCLLPFAPDWRWLQEREDTPWYPTVRLFRQVERGNWAGVVARVCGELAAIAPPVSRR